MTKTDLDTLVSSIVPAGHWDTHVPREPFRSAFVVAVRLPGLKDRAQVLRRLRRALRRSLPVGVFGRLHQYSNGCRPVRGPWERIEGALR